MPRHRSASTYTPANSPPVIGAWYWRASEYEIVDDVWVRPVAGADFERYNPWHEGYEKMAKQTIAKPAYIEFANLASSASLRPIRRKASLESYVSHSRGWGSETFAPWMPMDRPGILTVRKNGYVSQDRLSKYSFWFPGYDGPIPKPHTIDFWRHYAEPIHEIVGCANEFRMIATQMEELRLSKGPLSSNGIIARTYLDSILWPLRMTTDTDAWNRIVSPSLIATLGLMMLEDLTARARKYTVICSVCSELVRRSSPKAVYCSTQCRDVRNTRASRARKASSPVLT